MYVHTAVHYMYVHTAVHYMYVHTVVRHVYVHTIVREGPQNLLQGATGHTECVVCGSRNLLANNICVILTARLQQFCFHSYIWQHLCLTAAKSGKKLS